MQNTKMDGKSLNPQEELLALIKEKFPEVFSEGNIDCQKLKQALGETVDLDHERYGLTWAGKSNCFRVIQEPTTATLKPAKAESVDFDNTGNLFIEGDNLEVLKILQKPYYGKVKMIYIDPPYNTGNDFIYNDNFKQNKSEYEEQAGIKDADGNHRGDGLMKNSKDRGHYHSDWLNMMYPRLFLARNLLRQDGVIFVSIDDNEVHNLRMVMNEIFGEENFVAEFIWKRRSSSALANFYVSSDHEYVLAYQRGEFEGFQGISKSYSNYKNPNNDPKGAWTLDNLTVGMTKDQRPNQFYDLIDPETGKSYPPNPNRVWAYIKSSMDKMIKEGRIFFPEDTNKRPMLKRYKSDLKTNKNPISSLIDSEGSDTEFYSGLNSEGTKIIQDIFGAKIMDYPKPVSLIKSLTCQVVNDHDIILDFFAGSGTTAHAVMALNAEDGGNRKCISVQLPELCDEKSEAYKAGYKTIADISKERIRRAGKQIREEENKQLELDGNKLDTGFKVFKLDQSNFKIWRPNIADEGALLEQMNMFVDNVKEESTQENILYELILKSGLDLNVVVEKQEVDSKTYFTINKNKLVICLEAEISKEVVDSILELKPEKVICLDKAFGGNDQLKTNTILQMETAKIDFKVI